jgi:hypothetical protein
MTRNSVTNHTWRRLGPGPTFVLLAAAVWLAQPDPAYAQTQPSILSTLAQIESGGDTTATNPNSTSAGEYQDTQAALAEAGILTINSPPTAADDGADASWTNVTFLPNPYGITSEQDLLNASPQVQTAIETTYLDNTWAQDESQGLTSYEGQTVNGQVINQSAILGCSELLGTSGCASYLATGQASNPALTDTAEADIAQDSQADSSMITGSATTPVAQSQPSVAAGNANGAGYAMYCNQAASAALSTQAQASVTNAVDLASTPTTGYSLANGSSILNPTAGEYSEFSCLNNLFNQGLNILFSPPNLSGILNELIQAACTKAESYIETALQPLDQSFYQSATIDGFSPGFGLATELNNTGTVGTSVNGIETGLSPSSITSTIAGQTAGADFPAPTFGDAY